MQRFRGRKVTVTGGTGTIGTPLVGRLLELGAEVTAVSLDSEARVRAVLPEGARFQRRDLTDFAECQAAAAGQDMIFHLMAVKGSTQIGTSRVASAFVPFVMCNTNMMEAAFRAGVSGYLFVGSICAYPNLAVRREDDMWSGPPVANDRFTGIAKRTGEAQGETYLLEHGWQAVKIVRPSNVYGPNDDFDPRTAQVVPALIARLLGGENPLTVAGDGSAVRDFIFVEDVVEGMLRAMLDAPPCLPINLGDGKGISVRELVGTLVEVVVEMGLLPRVEVRWMADRPQGDTVRILDTTRARQVLGFTPPTSLREGLRRTVEWYVTHRDLADRRGKELHG